MPFSYEDKILIKKIIQLKECMRLGGGHFEHML